MDFKSFIKFTGALAAGAIGGLAVSTAAIAVFTDMTVTGFIHRFLSLDFIESLVSFIVGIGAFFAALAVSVVIHEAGHLVAGLLSGYRFVSFRLFNTALIRKDGNFRLRHYGIAGTGGRCLLDPPDVPADRLSVFWYNAGGVIANILLFLALLPLMWLDLHPLLKEWVFIFLLTDALMTILNGVPMRLGGIGNDAHHILISADARDKEVSRHLQQGYVLQSQGAVRCGSVS